MEHLTNAMLGLPEEKDVLAPVDYGSGPGIKSNVRFAAAAMESVAGPRLAARNAIPAGGATANVTGVFGAAVAWPIIPLHVVLLPDGRVMNYGTSQTGQQGGQLVYDTWDPTLGTGGNAHLVLPNTTSSDIFCSSQSVMTSGDVLVSGGDMTVSGQRNFARNDTNVFSPTANSLTTNTPMTYARWYGSLLSLSNGQLAVFGGYQNATTLTPIQPALTPELYDPGTRAWASLTGATSSIAFGTVTNDWYYPRAFVAPGGNIFILGNEGRMYSVSTTGIGSIAKYPIRAPLGGADLPTVPFAPGKVLSVRQNQQVVVIDFSKSIPVVTPTDPIDQIRHWASGTILADGEVLITGGSQLTNQLTGVAYAAQLWNPTTGHWTTGASATKPRLYHSNALLLPDATVLTGGGGAPGPVKNLNAEIFYPPYLYASGGTPAVRPVLSAVTPQIATIGGTIGATVGPADLIQRLTFVRTGSATHSYNSDQRFIDLIFTQNGQNLTATLPNDQTVLVPGFYMLFAINSAGVPSIAMIVKVS